MSDDYFADLVLSFQLCRSNYQNRHSVTMQQKTSWVLLLFLWAGLGECFVPSVFQHPGYPPSLSGSQRKFDKTTTLGQRVRAFLPTTTATRASSVTNPTQQEPSKTLDYNWKEQWYALTFADYVPRPSQSAEVVPAAVFGHPLVLWRSSLEENVIYCADDVCPHRSAALSEGRLRDGKLECYYHGWQFSGEQKGACVTIPQLSRNASSIPRRACLCMRPCRIVEGIVWVWMGDDEPPNKKDPPRQDHELDDLTGQRAGCILNDFQIDLPYDWSYLVENLIDPAHIPISHDRTPGGGKREDAEAYQMEIDEDSISSEGFTGRYRVESKAPDGPWTKVRYDAPGVVRQIGTHPKIVFGAALHCMPLALGRSRLLFRAYFGGIPWLLTLFIKVKPQFLRNLNSCKVLEQDVGLITTQEDHFARHPDRSLNDDFLLLGSSDALLATYRRWMDMVGPGMPWFQGLATRSTNVANHLSSGGELLPPSLHSAGHRASGQDAVETRYHRHVMHCPQTRKALKRVQVLKWLCLTASIGSATLTAGMIPMAPFFSTCLARRAFRACVFSMPVFAAAFLGLQRLERAFFVSFKRKDQMRREKGGA